MFKNRSILLCCINNNNERVSQNSCDFCMRSHFSHWPPSELALTAALAAECALCTVHSALGLKLTALRNSIKSLNHIGQCHVWYSDTALTLAGPFDALMQQKKGCKLNWKLSVSSCQNQQSSFTLSQAECRVCYNIKCGYLFNVTAGVATVCLSYCLDCSLPPAARAVNIVKVSLVKLISDTLCFGPAWLSVCLKCGCGLRLTAQL